MATTDQAGPTTLGSGTVAALESAWADIRSRHPEIPEHVVFRIGTGRKGASSTTLGSWTIQPDWEESRSVKSRAKSDRDQFHAVFIAGETLALHPVKLLEVLIHEAVHALASARGVKDTSRQYRYHNRRFRALAEEMGLEWTHLQYKVTKDPETGERVLTDNPAFDPKAERDIHKNPPYLTEEAKADETIGFSDMTITKATATAYRDTIANLDKNVSVQLNAIGVAQRPPQARKTVNVIKGGKTAIEVSDHAEAVELLGHVPDEVEIQKLGVKVYQGLVERKLLTGHIFWVEG